MSEKRKGLLCDAAIYAFAFAAASFPFRAIDNLFASAAVFTSVATVMIFIASCVLRDVSVYDPYWSVAPVVILAACMVKYRLYTVNAFVVLSILVFWSVRLTGNWYYTYKGIGHEDWRYSQYRERSKAPVFYLISFFGLHFIPTAVVYGGMISALYAAKAEGFSPHSAVGAAVMIGAVLLEYISDRAIHRFLREHKGERRTCDISLWRYSRHPNYLGEMLFWTGLYLYFLPLRPDVWYRGLWFLSIILLFLFVSIPMMEKHNEERRPDYAEYKAKTSMLLLLPPKRADEPESEDRAVHTR